MSGGKPRLIFLGTGAATPSPNRFVSSILLEGLYSNILIDVGEGAQIRLQQIGFDVTKLDIIAITHLHGDHVLGLVPLLQSYMLRRMSIKATGSNSRRLRVIGPKPLCKVVSPIVENSLGLIICLEITSCDTWIESDRGDILVKPVPMNHGDCECYGYLTKVLIDKKRLRTITLFISGDGICEDRCLNELMMLRPDIVIHEATYIDRDIAKARGSFHATMGDAARLACSCNAKVLVLTHVSSRYNDEELEEALYYARRFVDVVMVAKDLSILPLYIF